MLANSGGPQGFTDFVRSIGDRVTRLDRIEPDLNEGTPGDPRDTTSPVAMLDTLRKLALGDTLSSSSRQQLIDWLVANTTGDHALHAESKGDGKARSAVLAEVGRIAASFFAVTTRN